METVNSIASQASKLIWGEQNTTQGNETAGQEPISGEQGKGTVEDPYDQGNSDRSDPNVAPSTTNSADVSSKPVSTFDDISPEGSALKESSNRAIAVDDTPANKTETFESIPSTKATDLGTNPSGLSEVTAIRLKDSDNSSSAKPVPFEDITSNEGKNSSGDMSSGATSGSTTVGEHGPSYNSANASQGGAPEPLKDTDKTGVVAGHTGDVFKGSDAIPSERSENTGVAPSSGGPPEFKQQGADKPSDEPTGEQSSAVKDSKNEAEDLVKNRDPNDHSGEPMKVHDDSDFDQRRDSKAGNDGGEEHGKESKGTGEQWVKTSGLAADGGDFDVTKPGAGREADRLLEEKGIHKTEAGKLDTSNEKGGAETADKPSKMEKLKEKLHIGHKS